MGIEHKPASEDTEYCDNGGTWYINGGQISTFPLTSFYKKEGTGIWEIKFKGANEQTVYTVYFSGKSTDVWGSTVLPVGSCNQWGWRHLTRNGNPEPPLYPNTSLCLCNSEGAFTIVSQIFTANSSDSNFIFNIEGQEMLVVADKNSIVSVTCNCPPNNLDCGDCCLDCESTLSQIKSIRMLVAAFSL